MRISNLIVRSFLLFIALVILGVSIYVTVSKDKQRNNGENVQVQSEEVVKPTTTPSTPPTKAPQPDRRNASASGVIERRDEAIKYRAGASIEEIQGEIRKVFEEGYETDWALFISDCESGFDPFAINPAGYYGLFQYSPSTYKNCGGTDIWDWSEQIIVTKKCMFDGGRQDEFPYCSAQFNLGR